MARRVLRFKSLAVMLVINLNATVLPAAAQQNTGGGTVYYIGPWEGATQGGTAVMTTMSSDGSNKDQLGLGMFGSPSTELHNTFRWFIYTKPIPDSFYPNGNQRSEVFAFRGDYDFQLNNNVFTRVQLTDDITLQPMVGSTDWVPGDEKISFKGRRWSSAEPDATVVEAGLYTASLAFGVDGNIIGLDAQPTTPAVPFPLTSEQWPAFKEYSWEPTGIRFVYAGQSAGLWVANVLTGSHTQIHTGFTIGPQWSPDGAKIAFTNNNLGIWIINSNGTGAKEIVRRTSLWSFVRPYWSSDASHLVFTGQGSPPGFNLEVFRATANGKHLTNLTNTPSPFNEYPQGWR